MPSPLLQSAVKAAGEGDERMLFADTCNKLNKKLKKKRCIFLISERAAYVFAIKKNPTKDKEEKRVKPWVFICKRRFPLKDIRGLVLSTLQDCCMDIQVQVNDFAFVYLLFNC